jgi:rsbT co-antagonist protein RsbR
LLVVIAEVATPELLPVLIMGPLIVVALALPYASSRTIRDLSVAACLMSAVLGAINRFVILFDPFAPALTSALLIGLLPVAVGLTLLLLGQFSSRLNETLAQMRSANQALHMAQAGLEGQVAERTAALQAALAEVEARAAEQTRLLAEVEQQRATIRELSVPVLPVRADTLVMPLVGALDSERLRLLQEQALHTLERWSARRLLLDITGVPIVDSMVAQGLIATVRAGRLLGAV